MKSLPSLLPALLAFLLGAATARAQTSDATTPSPGAAAGTPSAVVDTINGADTPAPGSTVITSDELHMDQASHVALFTGNVVVVGTNFNMKCQEMTVYFTKDSKIDNIIAKGDVVILQPGRVTHCGQAQYFRDEDKFVLTDQPSILDNNNQIEAPEITIYRTKQSLYTKGHTKTTIVNGIGPSNSAAAAATPGAK